MTTAKSPRPIHVERTADPTVLCWVVRHPKLDVSPPGRRQAPTTSPLGQMMADGSIADIAVRNCNVLISTDAPDSWSRLAARVQTALLDELELLDDAASHWLLGAVESTGRALSIAEIQQVVDRAAGTVMNSHGGGMVVAAVDGDTVRLRSHGACTGCGHSDDTILGLITPALRTAYPEIASVSVDRTEIHR